MIEADIKKFLNDRVPNDPEFKALNRQIEGLGGLLAAEADKEKLRRMRRRLANAADYCAGVNFPNTAALYFPTARSQYNNSNIFLSSHYANNIGWGNTNTFKLKINDAMDTFVYLYTDGASASYTMWRLAGAYNGGTFLAQSTRTAISFTGLPSDISYTAMDMSADGDIVCVATGNEANRLTVLKRSSGSNTAYTAVTLDAQPGANASALCISGDGRVIFVSHTAAPYLTVYIANADRSAYTRQSLAELGVSVSRAVYIVAASFDGATFALGYNQNTAATPAVDVYRLQPGGVYAPAGVDYLSLYSLGILCYGHREGLQISRDGNTLLMFLRQSTNYYEPVILKFDQAGQRFAFDATEHNNQIWRLSYSATEYGGGLSYRDINYELSADGNWLFSSQLYRSTSSPYSVYNLLRVMDVSGGVIRQALPVHSALLSTTNPGDEARYGASYWAQHYFWVDPKMRFVWRGVIPYTNYTNDSPYYAYYLHYNSYASSDIIMLDGVWTD